MAMIHNIYDNDYYVNDGDAGVIDDATDDDDNDDDDDDCYYYIRI